MKSGWGLVGGVVFSIILDLFFQNCLEARQPQKCGSQIYLLASEVSSEQKLDKKQVLRVITAIRSTFKTLRTHPEVLPKRWREENLKNDVMSVGFCFAATNAAYFLLGGKRAGFTPMVASYRDPSGQKATHWWVRGPNGETIDPTADQYYEFKEEPPYCKGRGNGFCRTNDAPTKSGKEIIKLAVPWLKARGYRANGLPIR